MTNSGSTEPQIAGRTTLRSNLGSPAGASPVVVLVHRGKNSGVAALLSFFWCGAGQIYNGQIAKGVIFMVLYFMSLLLLFVLVGFVTTPILWIIGMVDAYRNAERLNHEAGEL